MSPGTPIPLSVDQLMARSREITGIDRIDDEVIEPLSVLHRSLCNESSLHELGALGKQDKLLRMLNNRLRMKRDFACHPEIADEPVDAPVFVTGMARSGTTKLQKLLAASGHFNWLPFWQAFNPALFSGVRGEPTTARIDEARAFCAWFDRASPDAKRGHAFETFEPEEDTVLTEGSFVTSTFGGYAQIPSYLAWFSGQSYRAMFAYLRDALKYLQWQGLADRSKRWVLKAPIYYGIEDQLLESFPDAVFVMAHRSPLETIPSTCKLVQAYRRAYMKGEMDAVAKISGFPLMMDRHLAVRSTLESDRFLDLAFDDLSRLPANVLADRIFGYLDMPLPASTRMRIRAWERNHPRHKGGRFEYSLDEFGLDAADIRTAMAPYFDFLARLDARSDAS